MKNIILDTFSNQRVSDVIAQERIYTTCRHIVSLSRERDTEMSPAQFERIVDWFIEFDFYALREHFALYDTNTLTISFTEGYCISPSVFTVEIDNISEVYVRIIQTLLCYECEDLDDDESEHFVNDVMTPMYRAIERNLLLLTRY